jgi:hypothetical protein
MRNTLTFFHTAEAARATITVLLNELAPDLPVRHVLDPEPLERAIAAGQATAAIEELAQARMREAIGEDTRLLVCTCSTLGAAAQQMTGLPAPVLRIDQPMAAAAARIAAATPPPAERKILVAACLATTVKPTHDLVRRETLHWPEGASIAIDDLQIPEAWPLFEAGDRAGYAAAIAVRLRESAAGYAAIVLAQASMAGAAPLVEDLGIPVLSSPRPGVATAIEQYRASYAGSAQT